MIHNYCLNISCDELNTKIEVISTFLNKVLPFPIDPGNNHAIYMGFGFFFLISKINFEFQLV